MEVVGKFFICITVICIDSVNASRWLLVRSSDIYWLLWWQFS